MRLLHLLFAIYVFGLSLTTCTDGMAKDDCGATTSHFHTKQADQHTQDECCSPFCTCACCSGFVLANSYTMTAQVIPQNPTVFSYSENSLSEIAYSIWQPPKLA